MLVLEAIPPARKAVEPIMVKQHQRRLSELLDLYRDYLLSKVSKVRILGEADERELKDVFVELSIVDQRAPQQHGEFLGLMDSAMRRRFNPFADANREDAAPEMPGASQKETRRCVRPAELLRCRTKAIITGAPGCGKTTLLKYLALQAQGQERLAIWLELKAIDRPLFAHAESAAARSGHLILPELWLKHLQAQLSLNAAEIRFLHTYWQEKFQAHDIVVLLDGFDELHDEAIERSLNKCIGQFASSLHDNTLLISTRPYAQARLGYERLQELEIEPLNQRQIGAFLNCYYPNDAAIKSLLKTLRERSSLRELLHVPLLLGVVLRLHGENRFTDERLKLYEAIIVDLIHKLDRSKSVNRRFKINDEGLRSDFLKFLAFERLLRDPLGEEEQEANRIVFSYDLLKEKARTFLAQEYASHNPRHLANDALATPLLREVGMDTYAFTHLTLQEYLAACAFAAFYQHKGNEFEGLRIFCRAYHNPTIVEMEVLPMILGKLTNGATVYDTLDLLPESLIFTNLRLKLRGLTYNARVTQAYMERVTSRVLNFLDKRFNSDLPYIRILVMSLTGLKNAPFVNDLISSLRSDRDSTQRWQAAWVLGKLANERAVEPLIMALSDKDFSVRHGAVEALGNFAHKEAVNALIKTLGHEDRSLQESAQGALENVSAVEPLIEALRDESGEVRGRAAIVLGKLGSERAVDPLIRALSDEDAFAKRTIIEALGKLDDERAIEPLIAVSEHWSAVWALGQMRNEKAIEALINFLKDKGRNNRSWVASALAEQGSERAVEPLIGALSDEDKFVRSGAAYALGQLRSERAVESLIGALSDEEPEVRWATALALTHLGNEDAIDPLIEFLSDGDHNKRRGASNALGELVNEKAVDPLIKALSDEDFGVRDSAARALEQFAHEKVAKALTKALSDGNRYVRGYAALVLGRLGSEKAIEPLISMLADRNASLRQNATLVLGNFDNTKTLASLIEAMNDDDLATRDCAAKALGRVGNESVVEPLIKALNSSFPPLQSSAAEALSNLKVACVARGLRSALRSEETFVRLKAVGSIGYYTLDPNVLDELTEIAKHNLDKEVGIVAVKAVNNYKRKLELLGHFIPAGAAQPLSDNASKEGVLVHEVGLIVSAAGHFFREVLKYDEGIDGEIEFRDAAGRGSGQRVYLQLKSGDSYLVQQRSGKEIFRIKKPRHAHYWSKQPFPVLLVIRDSGGRVRWMNVTEYLKRHGPNIKQIEFQGESFTAESVKQMCTRFAR